MSTIREESGIKLLEDYLAKIKKNPQTVEDFIEAFIFWGQMQMGIAAGGVYGRPPLGIVPHDTEIDDEVVKQNCDPWIMLIIGNLVVQACDKFNLAPPGFATGEGEIKFEDWFNSAAENLGKMERYNKIVFGE